MYSHMLFCYYFRGSCQNLISLSSKTVYGPATLLGNHPQLIKIRQVSSLKHDTEPHATDILEFQDTIKLGDLESLESQDFENLFSKSSRGKRKNVVYESPQRGG